MERRELGGTGWDVTEVGLGTWTMGGVWSEATDEQCREAVRAALDSGVNFLDTADVYGSGRAERVIRDVLDEYDADERVYVATKAGRRLDPHVAADYDYEHLAEFVDGSRERLGVDTLDLVQLHCPPTEAYYQPETFEAMRTLREEGKVEAFGVSVEKVEEARKAIEYDGVESVQIIFNPFRQRPADAFFDEAAAADVGIIVRVPLASALLADAFDREPSFREDDHRKAAAEDGVDAGVGGKGGETFSGVPFEAGLDAVDDLRPRVPADATMAQYALRWILDHEAVTTVIPGSTDPTHVRENATAAEMAPLSNEEHGAIRDIYEEHVHEHCHHQW